MIRYPSFVEKCDQLCENFAISACEFWFKSSSGSFTSPGYPDAHRKGVICWYHIAVSNNKSIKIDFPVISLKNNSVCFDEYIKIYEDTTTTEDTLKAKYCGQGARTFYSYSNIVHIRFKPVYYSPQLPVFSANYSEIDKGDPFLLYLNVFTFVKFVGFRNNLRVRDSARCSNCQSKFNAICVVERRDKLKVNSQSKYFVISL